MANKNYNFSPSKHGSKTVITDYVKPPLTQALVRNTQWIRPFFRGGSGHDYIYIPRLRSNNFRGEVTSSIRFDWYEWIISKVQTKSKMDIFYHITVSLPTTPWSLAQVRWLTDQSRGIAYNAEGAPTVWPVHPPSIAGMALIEELLTWRAAGAGTCMQTNQ